MNLLQQIISWSQKLSTQIPLIWATTPNREQTEQTIAAYKSRDIAETQHSCFTSPDESRQKLP